MLKIEDTAALARALDSPIPPQLKDLLRLRHDQLIADTDHEYDLGALALFLVIDPHDNIESIEAAAGYPLITSPSFEWVCNHGGWFEAVIILSDDGYGVALFVPDREDVNPTVLSLLRSEADRSTKP